MFLGDLRFVSFKRLHKIFGGELCRKKNDKSSRHVTVFVLEEHDDASVLSECPST